jgi:hypothetical protein
MAGMSVIATANVYVWCESHNCIGILDGRYGSGTTLGGPVGLIVAMLESMELFGHSPSEQ